MQSDFNKIEFWTQHLAASQTFAGGIKAYCKANGLTLSNYYKWKYKIRPLTNRKKLKKEKLSRFLPVLVSETVESDRRATSGLPEARWVAEVMTYLVRGAM